MALLRTLLGIVVISLAVVMGAFFSLQNTVQVPLDLLFVQLSERALALWLLLFLAVGCVLGLLTALGVTLQQRSRNVLLRRQTAKLELEVDKLRRFRLTEGD